LLLLLLLLRRVLRVGRLRERALSVSLGIG
jgi:hypothetical protein